MIRTFTARGYGCLEDVTLRLTPLHALIGPNDSGKSTILQAITTLCEIGGRDGSTRHELSEAAKSGLRRLTGRSISPAYLEAVTHEAVKYRIEHVGTTKRMESVTDSRGKALASRLLMFNQASLARHFAEEQTSVQESINRARLLRFRPESLRVPDEPILQKQSLEFADPNGLGLASVYQAINSRSPRTFLALEEGFQRLFPSVASLQVRAVDASHHALYVVLRDGTELAPEQMSEGMLYYLAFAALQYLSPVAVLCVEEPENGLHPARIKEVVGMLRRISEGGTQVILATHSPLVLNELDPTEVTVVTRPKGGATQVTPMTETANFQQRSRVYALGELWVSYADGEVEAPLMHAEQGAL